MVHLIKGFVYFQDCPGLSYEPGDALGFVCPNPTVEVEYLLQRSAVDSVHFILFSFFHEVLL